MDNRAIILRCLYENWADEASMIGDAFVTRIVDDALLGKRTQFRVPQGGDNFDLTAHIDTILSAASLLVGIIGIWISLRSMPPHTTPNTTDERDPPDHTEENTKDLVDILAKLIERELGVKPALATKYALLFIDVVSKDR